MPFPWLALAPLIGAVGGGLFDQLFGDDPPSPEQQLQMQMELDRQRMEESRYNISTPFGSSMWQGDTLVQEMSPQMQAMFDQQAAFRNQMMNAAMEWFGGSPMAGAPPIDTFTPDIPQDPWVPDDTPAFPDWLDMDWDERWERARELWGDDPSEWGVDGNQGIPFWMFEKGEFPKHLDPGALQTWWMNQGEDIGPIRPY